MNTMIRKHRQQGLTLIEILVALVISLFLLAGLLQLFISLRISANVHVNLSRVQENGRYALDYFSRLTRLAGSRSRFNIERGLSFNEVFPSVQAIQGTNNDGPNSSDTITVAFEGEGPGQGDVRNCVNAQVGENATASNVLSINNSNSLQCVSGGQTQPIVDNVENMQILYGENTDGDTWGVADRYVPANDVDRWDRVVSARISLLLRTAENNLADSPQPYTFNGATVTPASTDRYLRRVFTTTVTLRNEH